MISCVSENKTSGKCLWCRFLANATIRQSRAWSSPTAAHSKYRSGAHHLSDGDNTNSWNDLFHWE